MKEEELQLLKQKAEREKEMLKDHKKQLESVKKVSYCVITVQHTSSSCVPVPHTHTHKKGTR